MVKKAEYELSEVISSIESNIVKEESSVTSTTQPKIYISNRGFRNLLNEDYYLLFIFTLFISIVSINIFISCSSLQSNYHSSIGDIKEVVASIESTINHIPTNVSTWINHQTKIIDSITNDIIIYGVERPSVFLNTTINGLVNVLNPLITDKIRLVDLKLTIDTPNIPEIDLENWMIRIPFDHFTDVIRILISIPYYFGLFCIIISIIFILILFVKGVVLYLDYQFRYRFLSKPSFWIGIIFSFLFFCLMFSSIYIHYRYIQDVGGNIQNFQQQIHNTIDRYNYFIDQNSMSVTKFTNDNLNVLVNTTNRLVEQLKDLIEDNLSQILSNPINLYLEKLELIDILVNLDNFKVDPNIINVLWIFERIQSIFIGVILFFGIIGIFFLLLVICICCNRTTI